MFTGPLRANGTIDFEAALNARCSVGITADTNAVVLLERAFGPAEIPSDLRSRYYRYLGIPELPLEGDYFVSEAAFAAEHTDQDAPRGAKLNELYDEMSAATERPWTRAEFPRVGDWIDRNQQALILIEQGSLRSRFYSPLVTSYQLTQAALPLGQKLRSTVRLLVSRAMLRIADGDSAAAAADLMTCHRLAALLSQSSSLIDYLTSVALNRLAILGDQVLLAQPLTANQIAKYEADLSQLPPFRSAAETIDQCERIFILDSIQAIWKGRRVVHDSEALDGLVRVGRFDVNVVLRRCNSLYDDFATAMKQDDLRDRMAALKSVVEIAKRRTKDSISTARIVSRLVWESRRSYSESIADLLLGALSPAMVQLQTAADRALVYRDLLQVGLALAKYRDTHGDYPNRLESLVPQFLKRLPIDRYIDQPLHYLKIQGEGYVLYSVGEDQLDDGGQPIKADRGDLSFRVDHQPRLK